MFSSCMTYFYIKIKVVVDMIPSNLVCMCCWSSEQPENGSTSSL